MIRLNSDTTHKTYGLRGFCRSVLLIWLLKGIPCYSQQYNSVAGTASLSTATVTVPAKQDNNAIEEAPVTLVMEGVGSLEVVALVNRNRLFLPVQELFNFLQIKNDISVTGQIISGYWLQPDSLFRIDAESSRIVYQKKITALEPGDLLLQNGNLFLLSNYFGKVFGLSCQFDLYALTVSINTKTLLPVIRNRQLEKIHQNLKGIEGERRYDTSYAKVFRLFNLGILDWSVLSTQSSLEKSYTWVNLGLGAVVAGGELNISATYKSNIPWKLKNQLIQWRYVNNGPAVFRQVTAGSFTMPTIATLTAPVIGLQLTNAPRIPERSYGSFTISNVTKPGWMVELYLNNVLVNVTKADASGLYMFAVPMVYGNSVVKLKFIGPWGEEQISEKFITIPFHFTPLRRLQYTLAGGLVADKTGSRFTRFQTSYGLSRQSTIGSGVELLGTRGIPKTVPFLSTTTRIGQHLILTGEWAFGVRTNWLLNFRLPSHLQVDLSYTRYDKNQSVVTINYRDEKKLVLSFPIRHKKTTGFTRLTLLHSQVPASKINGSKGTANYTSAEWLLSVARRGLGITLTSFALLNPNGNPLLYSHLTLNLRLPFGLRFIPQCQYEYQKGLFSYLKLEAEKNIFKGSYVNLAFERTYANTAYNSSFTLGLRLDLSLVQTFCSIRKVKGGVHSSQSARGSVAYDARSHFLTANSQSAVGTGGIIFHPFLDLNVNGRRDSNEPAVSGLKVLINGGHTVYNKADSTLVIDHLDAHTYFVAELDASSFENISWLIKKQLLRIYIQPNQLRKIEIPVQVAGEVNGTVLLEDTVRSQGIGRIVLLIYDQNQQLAGRAVSETDGYFSFMGLAPGNYTLGADPVQLEKLKLSSVPQLFTIKTGITGDYVSGLKIRLGTNPGKIQ